MKPLYMASIIARAVCLVLGLLYLFGALFFGVLNAEALAGLLAVLAAVTPLTGRLALFGMVPLLTVFAATALVAKLLAVYQYLTAYAIPGNYYAWPQAVALLVALSILLGYAVVAQRRGFRTLPLDDLDPDGPA